MFTWTNNRPPNYERFSPCFPGDFTQYTRRGFKSEFVTLIKLPRALRGRLQKMLEVLVQRGEVHVLLDPFIERWFICYCPWQCTVHASAPYVVYAICVW